MAYDHWCAVFLLVWGFFLGGWGRKDSTFLNNNQLCVFVSNAVMKEQPLRSECAAGQIAAGSRTCILALAVAAFYTFIIHVEPI